jgi:hypothetical protein
MLMTMRAPLQLRWVFQLRDQTMTFGAPPAGDEIDGRRAE